MAVLQVFVLAEVENSVYNKSVNVFSFVCCQLNIFPCNIMMPLSFISRMMMGMVII